MVIHVSFFNINAYELFINYFRCYSFLSFYADGRRTDCFFPMATWGFETYLILYRARENLLLLFLQYEKYIVSLWPKRINNQLLTN